MTPAQQTTLDKLLGINDVLLENYPQHSGPEFFREMGQLAVDLSELAEELEQSSHDAIEPARVWRYAGNAWFDLGNGKDPQALEQATSAYVHAETRLEDSDDSVEHMKLDYSLGQALLGLSKGENLALAEKAQARLRSALDIAHRDLPAAVGAAEQALHDADAIVNLLRQVQTLDGEIGNLQRKIVETPANGDTGLTQQEPDLAQQMFGMLQDQFQQEVQQGKISGARHKGLDEIMSALGGMVSRSGAGQSLEENIQDRSQLDGLIQRMAEMTGRLGSGQPETDTRAHRLLELFQQLKTGIGHQGTRIGVHGAEIDQAMTLYQRLAGMTSALNDVHEDVALLAIEQERARQLAEDVRQWMRRQHIMLAQPLWSGEPPRQHPNRIHFSGPVERRSLVEDAAATIGLEIADTEPAGIDGAIARWHAIVSSGVAWFDLSAADPQVYYELGIALTLGTNLLLTARKGSDIEFDVAQGVEFYEEDGELATRLETLLDTALYSVQVHSKGSSVATTLDRCRYLADRGGDHGLARVALQQLEAAADDATGFAAALKVFNGFLRPDHYRIVLPRWIASYPDPLQRNCFIVMPFRKGLKLVHDSLDGLCREQGYIPSRGDEAPGQQIIASIWEEICQAHRVVVDLTGLNPNVCLELGMADCLGRETLLIYSDKGKEDNAPWAKFASIEKRRCHAYPLKRPEALRRELARFLD